MQTVYLIVYGYLHMDSRHTIGITAMLLRLTLETVFESLLKKPIS